MIFAVMEHVPEVVPEKKRMRPGKFFMFFILIMGAGYILNIVGNILNIIVAAVTNRSTYNMNPVNNLFESLNPVVILYVSVLGPVIEEYIFRWKLLNRLRPLGEKAAILFSALMFGLMHGNLSQILYATAIGVVLGYVSVKTGRLKYNCILHIMVNSYSTPAPSDDEPENDYNFLSASSPCRSRGYAGNDYRFHCHILRQREENKAAPGKLAGGD